MEALNIRNLGKHYKSFDLADVSFALEEGTITGFIGENGAGKTTTMKLVAGLARPTTGTIQVFGIPLEDMSENQREQLAVSFDEPVFPEKTRLVALERILRGIFIHWDSPHFFALLERFDIDKNKRVGELSKGMKAKLNIIIALCHHARLLLLDEPANGLDPMARDDFLGLLATFVRENRGTVLVSSHIVSDLEKLCSRFIFIHKGRILFDDTRENIKAKYEVAFVPAAKAALLPAVGIVSRRVNPLTGVLEVLARAGTLDHNTFTVNNPSLEEVAIMLIQEGKVHKETTRPASQNTAG